MTRPDRQREAQLERARTNLVRTMVEHGASHAAAVQYVATHVRIGFMPRNRGVVLETARAHALDTPDQLAWFVGSLKAAEPSLFASPTPSPAPAGTPPKHWRYPGAASTPET